MNLRNFFRRRVVVPDAPRLNSIFESEAERVRDVDPETERQWHSLRSALDQVRPGAVKMRTPARFQFRPGLAFGLAVIACAVAGILLFQPALRTVGYSTGRGQLSTVVLADSSEVTLNHTSELFVDRHSDPKGRHVVLKGEAFFRIRRTGELFVVSTDAGTVQVLGTEFNVRVRESRLEVAVVSGRVRVAGNPGTNSEVLLQAGTMVTCTKGGAVSAPEQILFADYPGWIHQKLLFQRSHLQSVCSEIEARFGVTVRIENPSLVNETITGALDSRSAEAAVATLSTLMGSKYRHEANIFALY
jgi:ferric-dicitrate binding protein FerR (iron transport regulator)